MNGCVGYVPQQACVLNEIVCVISFISENHTMKDLKNEEFMKGEDVNDVKLMKQMRNNELIDNDLMRKCDVKMRDRKQRNTKLLLK